MIVVLDTNVWISELVFAKGYGTPTRALERAMTVDVIASCEEIEDEIVRVLTKKFSWELGRAHSLWKPFLLDPSALNSAEL